MDHREANFEKRERAIATLAKSLQRSVEEVRVLFTSEYARLEASAKVRTHLDALVSSNVRALLRRTRVASEHAA